MAVRWSRIHAELGLAPAELTYAMVARAVEQRVREADDLDWKQALPVEVDKKLKEFAKDVAAMANTRTVLRKTRQVVHLGLPTIPPTIVDVRAIGRTG